MHLSLRQLEQYQARTLAPGELIPVARHLAVCDVCHERFTALAPVPEVIAPLTLEDDALSVEEDFHLDYEEHLAPYVDGTADEIDCEIVETHTEMCAVCAEGLRELFALKEEMAHLTTMPLATASAPVSNRASSPSLPKDTGANRGTQPFPLTRSERFIATFSSYLPASGARRIGAGVLAVTIVIGAVVLLRLWLTPGEDCEANIQNTANITPALPANTNRANDVNGAANTNASSGEMSSSQSDAMTRGNDDKAARGEEFNRVRNNNEAPRSDASLMSLNDGGRTVGLDRAGRLTGLEDVPNDYRQAVERALREQQLETSPDLAALINRKGRLRSGNDDEESFALVNPVGTLTRTPRPAFRWQALDGAIGYTVRIYDADLKLIATSPPLVMTHWTPPAPLAPGRIYSWQVTATKDDEDDVRQAVIAPAPQSPEARFQVLSESQTAEVRRAERIAGDSHLLRAVVYARFGLLGEAENELRKLRAANPRSTATRRLSEKLRPF
ncbi:MAG: zf-HC2 domain-containing protein [Pyrinomonadaceae bacterium MAG19_C2-C3]|nr:zf-HC2 domain-containing protein [Pyrinomonadaceae bacterium MAG19_C2-C3]